MWLAQCLFRDSDAVTRRVSDWLRTALGPDSRHLPLRRQRRRVHQVQGATEGAEALTATQQRHLLVKLRALETCRQRDLTDPVTLLIATGLRR